MSFEHLTASRASIHDMAEIIRLQGEGEAWNASKGFVPLSFRYSAAKKKEFLELHLRESEMYIFKNATEAVGLVKIQWKDPIIWGDAGWDPLAAYVHGVTIGYAWHGEGLGAWILKWSEKFIKDKGMNFCRVDCSKDNLKLCGYYEANGYKDKGLVTLKSGWVSRKYEKALA